ncbi:MAG: biopolymer transporter ExbD [Candidatus Omnitrophica bacterium]|nr:biopolymer transporter ExbD [Candidatus Omnitrophota bacterium]
MRFKKNIKLSFGLNALDIVPLVNLALLLVAFFILSWTLVTRPSVRLNIPFASTSQIAGKGAIELIITSENKIIYDSNVIQNEGIKKLLAQASLRKQSVLIKADKRASLDQVSRILDLCREAGIRYTNIATD